MLWMNEIAVASSLTLAIVVLSTLSFPEVRNGAIFSMNLAHVVVFAIHGFKAFFSLLLLCELYVNVAHHVLSDVICYNHV